mgnify:CR=1 FL=1
MAGVNNAVIWWFITFLWLTHFVIREYALSKRQDKLALHATFAALWVSAYALAPVLIGVAAKMPGVN